MKSSASYEEVEVVNKTDIRNPESEAGVIASLILNPELSFYSENLLPNHFSDTHNSYMYTALCMLAQQGIKTADAYNIFNVLSSTEATRKYASELPMNVIDEYMNVVDVLARKTVEEYRLLVSNVLDAALRRNIFQRLRDCEMMCQNQSEKDLEQKIYAAIDDVMLDFSSANDIPQYKEIVDECWTEIKARQNGTYSGIKFKFPVLNEFATIEPGELFIFAAEAKQGKSMMLLNCAVDLLRQNKKVFYIDSELNSRLFTCRILSHLSKIDFARVKSGSYTNEEEQKLDRCRAWLKEKSFTHLYMPMFDSKSIYTAVKKVNHTQGIDVLIIDYFKSSSEGDAFASYQEMGRLVDKTCSR